MATRMHKKRAVTITIVLLAGLAGWHFYRNFCPAAKVPKSHFVKPKKSNSSKVVVFVHGVLGDMDNTWSNNDQKVSWPELLSEDNDFINYDVYVYGYQSPCEGASSNIAEIATRFKVQLKDDNFFSKYREIYFIAHSMGGLVTEKMLTLLRRSDPESLQHVRAVILIAVPSAGADAASVGTWFSSNPQFTNM